MGDTQVIAIIGAGNVGAGLGRRLAESGCSVRFGVRDSSRIEGLVADCPGAVAMAPAEAAAGADVVILALPGGVTVDVASKLGDLSGKVVVDCANPLRWDDGPVWTPPRQGSLAEAIAAACPGARVIKAFNTFGAEFHRDPELGGGARVEVPMAGDDADAKEQLAAIARRAGFDPIDAGPLRNASVLENVAMLWIHLALAAGHGRDFVFQMTRRGGA